jgi:hypothetical protein
VCGLKHTHFALCYEQALEIFTAFLSERAQLFLTWRFA